MHEYVISVLGLDMPPPLCAPFVSECLERIDCHTYLASAMAKQRAFCAFVMRHETCLAAPSLALTAARRSRLKEASALRFTVLHLSELYLLSAHAPSVPVLG
jgi:hypothetical protein